MPAESRSICLPGYCFPPIFRLYLSAWRTFSSPERSIASCDRASASSSATATSCFSRAGDVSLDGGQDVAPGDAFVLGQHGAQLVGDHLPGQIDLFDDGLGLAVLVDKHPAGRGFAVLGLGNRQQGHVGPLLHVSIDQRRQRVLFQILVARGHQHVALIADRLQGLGRDLGGVSGAQLRLLVDVEDPGMLLADRVEHLVGPRADHHQKATETLALENGDLAIDGRHGIDLEADFAQVAPSHAGAFAGGQHDDHRLFGNPSAGVHARSPGKMARRRQPLQVYHRRERYSTSCRHTPCAVRWRAANCSHYLRCGSRIARTHGRRHTECACCCSSRPNARRPWPPTAARPSPREGCAGRGRPCASRRRPPRPPLRR